MKSVVFSVLLFFGAFSEFLPLAEAGVTGDDVNLLSGKQLVAIKSGSVSKIEYFQYSSDWKTVARVPLVVPGSPVTNFPGVKIGGVWGLSAGMVYNPATKRYEAGGAFGCWTDKAGNGICTTREVAGTTELRIREGVRLYSGNPLAITSLRFWGDFGEIVMDDPIPVSVTIPPSTTPTKVISIVSTGNMLVWGKCGVTKVGAVPCVVFYHRVSGKTILFIHASMIIVPGTKNSLGEVAWGGKIRGGRASKKFSVYNTTTHALLDVVGSITTDGVTMQRVFVLVP